MVVRRADVLEVPRHQNRWSHDRGRSPAEVVPSPGQGTNSAKQKPLPMCCTPQMRREGPTGHIGNLSWRFSGVPEWNT